MPDDKIVASEVTPEGKRFEALARTDLEYTPAAPRRVAGYTLRMLRFSLAQGHIERESFGVDNIWEQILPLLDRQALRDTVQAERNEGWGFDLDELRRNIILGALDVLPDRFVVAAEDVPTDACVRVLADCLELGRAETRLLDYAEKLFKTQSLCESLSEFPDTTAHVNRACLAAILEIDVEELAVAIKPGSLLRQLGLIRVDNNPPKCLREFVQTSPAFNALIWSAPESRDQLLALLFEPLSTFTLSLDDFPHQADAADRLCRGFSNAREEASKGVTALIHGAPRSGKSAFAQALAQALGVTARAIRVRDSEGESLSAALRMSYYLIAQRMMRQSRDLILVFDEVRAFTVDAEPEPPPFSLEDLLSAGSAEDGDRDIAEQDTLLHNNPVPAIWIASDSVRPRLVSRITLPVTFTAPPRAVRHRMVEKLLGIPDLPERLIREIAADDRISESHLRRVRELVVFHRASEDPVRAQALIRTELAAILRGLHGTSRVTVRLASTDFDLGLLNFSGGITADRLVAALKRRGRGSCLFSGLPGTGKTEFAHAIAESIDRQLVVRRASDLLAPWVGETEQRLAALFGEINVDASVLFLDEVDSFLRDRRTAVRGWEATQVNELLQQMEQFPGIFIAATNLVSDLDGAALRRFDFKLEFRPLTLPQRRVMFAREAVGDDTLAEELPAQIVARLGALQDLTVGDFANVCRQRELLGETLDPEEFLRRLGQECRWKSRSQAA